MTKESTGNAGPGGDAGQDDGVSKELLRGEINKLKDRIAQLESSQKDRKSDPEYFAERLVEEIARSSRYKYEFCLLFVDLDNLELFSKKYGDEAAAEILNMLDTVLRNTFRTADLKCQCARGSYGVILPYTDSGGGRIAAEKLRQTIERVFMLKSKSTNIILTVSAGLASYPKDAVSPEQLTQVAESTLSKAKSEGGNRVYLALEAADTESQEKERRLFNDTFLLALDNEVMRCARFGQKFSLMLLAVTNLEDKDTKIDSAVRAGIMRAVFKLVNANVRTIDKNFFYTDTRFALLLPHTGPDGTVTVAQKLIQSLTGNPVLRNNEVDINISVNIGISTFPTDEITGEGLLRKTEEALSKAVKKGANSIQLAADVKSLSCKSGRKIGELIIKVRESGPAAIYSLLAAVDVTEHYERAHSQTVAKYAIATGLALALPNVTIRRLRIMALLHDLGKVCMPDDVIVKPGPLDDPEWDMMMQHPQLGADIVQQVPDFSYCCPVILAHHERPDGNGYPKGLKASQIPLESQIIAVAEAYDDMTTPRPYRRQVFPAEAVEELKKRAGTHFDLNVVKAFVKALYSSENSLLK